MDTKNPALFHFVHCEKILWQVPELKDEGLINHSFIQDTTCYLMSWHMSCLLQIVKYFIFKSK